MPQSTAIDVGVSRTLVEGQRIDQARFHALYQAMPSGTRAELINGVVLMPSPAGALHSRTHFPTIAWLGYYVENTPGLEGLDNASTVLGLRSELQPDAMLRILPQYGGRTRTDSGFIQGVPEFIVEISHTSRYADLGPKFEDYERAGVLEYLVIAFEPNEAFWFVLRGGRFSDLSPSEDGIFRSQVFPGLWLDPTALFAGDTKRLRAMVDLGCASTEHAEFVGRLANARTP